MQARWMKWIIFLILGMCSQTIRPVFSLERKSAWKTSAQVQSLLIQMPAYVDTTLPAPELIPEPEYTWGFTNTIHWDIDSVKALVEPLGMTLLFFEVEARYDTIHLWGYVDAPVNSATFHDLPEGLVIKYRLLYVAQSPSGEFGISRWSEPEWSIQDASPPTLESIHILDLQHSQNGDWIIGPTIQLSVTASDVRGQVMQLVIHEKSISVDESLYHPILPPDDSVEVTLPYSLRTQRNEALTLTFWVVDVAAQESNKMQASFFWWPYEGEEEAMVCFPNPFNPEVGEVSIIKVPNTEVQEIVIYDSFGQKVRTLWKDVMAERFFEWDGKNDRGDMVSNGGYICIVKDNSRQYTKIAVRR